MTRFGCCLLVLGLAAGCAQRTAVVAPPTPRRESPLRVLSPQVDSQEEDQLRRDTATMIQQVEQMAQQLDPERFSKDQAETFSTVRNFLAGAKQAVATRDYLRASILVEKARVLAEELMRHQPSGSRISPPAGIWAN